MIKHKDQLKGLEGSGFKHITAYGYPKVEGWLYEKRESINDIPMLFEARVYTSGRVEFMVKQDCDPEDNNPIRLKTPAAKALNSSLARLKDEVTQSLESRIPDSEVKAELYGGAGIKKINVATERPADQVYNILKTYIKSKGE